MKANVKLVVDNEIAYESTVENLNDFTREVQREYSFDDYNIDEGADGGIVSFSDDVWISFTEAQ